MTSVCHAAAAPPNVLFFAVDDLNPRSAVMAIRWPRRPTSINWPRGARCSSERTACRAVCSPSRNGVLTGLRPQTIKIYDLPTNFRKSVPNVVTLPQHFKNNGYKTEALGKIFHVGHGNHEDPASWSVPHWKAQTVNYQLPENKGKLTREQARFENKKVGKADKLPRGAAVEAADVPDNGYADGQLADEAIRRLQQASSNAQQPFFLAVGFRAAAFAIQCSPEVLGPA